MNNPEIIGVDDGHNCIKVYAGRDSATGLPIQYKMLSRAAMGIVNMGQDDAITKELVSVDGDIFTVSESLSQFDNTCQDEYQTSKLSKALVYQALRNANLLSNDLKITSGLPVNRFYNESKTGMNKKLISEKKETLKNMSEVFNVYDKNNNLPKINIHDVCVLCEANAAFFDVLLDDNGDDTQIGMELELYEGGAGVIDIGGRTTDCVVVNPNGQSLNASRSATRNVGILDFQDGIRASMKEEHGLRFISEVNLQKALLNDCVYGLGNKKIDISEIVNHHKTILFKKLENIFDSTIGDGSDLPAIILVGGGSYFLKDLIEQKYQNIIIPDDVEFSNARGFYKIYKHYV